ncbi:MAG: hypothetical protein R2727_10330 [Bacteroidales bacterium]
MVNFEESAVIDGNKCCMKVSAVWFTRRKGGRGLAFINTLIYSFELGNLTPGINIKSPITVIVGTNEFDMFIESNKLWGM